MRSKEKKWYSLFTVWLVIASMLLPQAATPVTAMADESTEIAQTTGEKNPLKPEDLTFRKKFSYRNLFSSEVLIQQMDMEQFAGSGDGKITKHADDGKLTLENESIEKITERLKLGAHAPYSSYDLEVTEQTIGSNIGIELYRDDENRIVLSQNKPDPNADRSFAKIVNRVLMNSLDDLTVYQDIPGNTLEVTGNGLKFNGAATGPRGENFVSIAAAKQRNSYGVTVNAQSTDYGNAIIKLRKDASNGIFLVTNSSGALSYEIFKNGSSQGGSKIISSQNPGKPYTMEISIEGKNLIFSRYTPGGLQATQTVDVSAVFDLSDADILKDFEVVFGARGGSGNYVEYSDAVMTEPVEESYAIDFDGSLTVYNDQPDLNTLERTENGLKFKGATTNRGENFVSMGAAQQGLAYEAVIAGQTTAYGNAILKLRKDSKNGIFLVTNAAGVLGYEIFKNGSSQTGFKELTATAPEKPYTMQLTIDGKNVIFSRYTGGKLQIIQAVDVSASFDLSDAKVLKSFEVVFGARGGSGNYVEYSEACIKKAGNDSENYGELKLEVYANGVKTQDMILSQGEVELPYTIRADFAAESIGSSVKKGFLSVWKVKDANATLLQNNIELKGIDFSNPNIVKEYPAYLYCELEAGAKTVVTDFHHYYTGGAAQADPKPLHDETGALLQEGDTIWLAMTVRGYDIHSSYQGVYSFNIKTGELKLVSVMAFNLEGRGNFAPYHAADIIYNRMDDEWIVMPTAHNESPHGIKSGLIPQDPRTTPFQFVDVKAINYPNQSNEEDASLIYDSDVGKWRLVMCDSGTGGYQLPLLESDTWDGVYTEVARYAQAPCTGIQLQKLDGQYYVFFGRNTDNCEALRYPQMDQPVKLNIQSSPRSYNVWPVIIPFEDSELGITRYYMMSFDRETHGGAHSYGNIYLYEAEEYPDRPESEEKADPAETGILENGEITSARQLEQIRNNPSGNYVLKNHIDISEIENWVPIGDRDTPFTGTFDGNGYTITGLNINRPNADRVGLFGHTAKGAVIKNITIVQTDVKGRNYVGILAGYNEGSIQNSSVYGTVEAFSTGGLFVGQNVGQIEASSSGGQIKSTGSDSIGGFAGNNSANIGTIDLAAKGIIKNCYSLSNVTGNMNVGGFAGFNDCGMITDSYAKGIVDGTANVGGFIGNNGRNYGNQSLVPVSYSYADSIVTGTYNTGGFIGHNDGSLTKCFAVGSVVGQTNTGGLTGANNTKSILLDSFADVSVSGNIQKGGLIGYNRGMINGSGCRELEGGIGNSLWTSLAITMPDLLAAETYAGNGNLDGYTSDKWNIETGHYPQLGNVKIPEELYLVQIGETEGVTVHANQVCVTKDTQVMITMEVVSGSGIELEKLAVTNIEPTKIDDNTYSFMMPSHNVAVVAVIKSGEKKALGDLLDRAEQLKETDYIKSSWESFQGILSAARTVYESGQSGDADYKNAYEILETAMINTLIIRPDKTELQFAYDQNKDMKADDYEEESFAMFQAALNEAVLILNDENASQQQVDQAKLGIENARKALVLKTEPIPPRPTPSEPMPPTVRSVTLNDTEIDLLKNKTRNLKATVSPENSINKEVVWSSSNTKVATVDDTGKVTAVDSGSAIITATAVGGINCSATCKVNVWYSIDYVLKGGKNSGDNPDSYFKTKVTLKAPIRSGYLFQGWYIDSSYRNKITTLKSGDYVLYAKWKKAVAGKPVIRTVKSSKAKQFTVKLKSKVSGAKGYEITYALDSKFKKSKKTVSVNATSKTIGKLKSKKTYYVKVRAYTLDSAGKKIYSGYSSVKKVEIK